MEWIVGLIGVLVSNLVTYKLTARQASGRIDTTEAEKLWTEADRIRRELKRQNRKLELAQLRLREENHTLRNEMMKLQFALAPNIPPEIKASLVTQAETHIKQLRDTYEALLSEPINGEGGS